MKLLKALMIAAVLASALTLGACQNKTTTTTTQDTGYHK
jgi:predicted small secreted protein